MAEFVAVCVTPSLHKRTHVLNFPLYNLTQVWLDARMATETLTGDLLTAAEVAERLGKTVATVNRMAADGRIPTAHKLPGIRGARLFRATDIDLPIVTANRDRKARKC